MNNASITPQVHKFKTIKELNDIKYLMVVKEDGTKYNTNMESFIDYIKDSLFESVITEVKEIVPKSDGLKDLKERLNKLGVLDGDLLNINNNKSVEKKKAKNGSIYSAKDSNNRTVVRIKTGKGWKTINE